MFPVVDYCSKWDIDAPFLNRVMTDNPSFRGMAFGYTAETKFYDYLDQFPGISVLPKCDDHDRREKADQPIMYQGRRILCESKSLQSNSIRHKEDGRIVGKTQVDASDSRSVVLPDGTTLITTLLLFGGFDILAVNLHPFTGNWDFAFALNRDLPCSTYARYTEYQRQFLIASLVPITYPLEVPFTTDLMEILTKL